MIERHDFDPVSFLFGAIFVGAGLVLLGGGADAVPMQWAGPAVALLLGLVIVFAARPRSAPLDDSPSASDEP